MVQCPNCKEFYHENASFCPACGTPAPKSISVNASVTETGPFGSTTTEVKLSDSTFVGTYATFGERVLAFLIDAVIITIGTAILSAIFSGGGAFIAWILTAVYYGYFESSKYMGTPGKIVMKLKVYSGNGHPISFLNGVGRYLAKLISAIIFGIGYLFPLFTAKKQALHDMIANCVVIKASN